MSTLTLLLALTLPTAERGEVTFRPTQAEGSVPELFRLEAATFAFEHERVRETPGYTVDAVRFPSPIVSPVAENNTVHADYFLPRGEGPRRPAVIVLHILGADFALSRYMAARLADRGVAAMFVQLPYYGKRRPEGGSQRFLSLDIERSMAAMRQGVCDVRRATAWLASRPEIDPKRLGVTGISLGGIVASVSAAAEPTISEAVLLLAGGQLDEILWTMPEGARQREEWIKSGHTKAELSTLTRPFDPLTYADRLRGKRVLMISASADEVIPPPCARALWERAGRPPIEWCESGHYSAIGYFLPALRKTIDFFAKDADLAETH